MIFFNLIVAIIKPIIVEILEFFWCQYDLTIQNQLSKWNETGSLVGRLDKDKSKHDS